MRGLLLRLFTHRFLAVARWDLHFIALRIRNRLTGQDGKIARALAGHERPVYLNLGSGPRGLDDGRWVNVDGYPDRNVHFLLDLGRPMPFPDGAFDGVFCEHVLEHFSLEDGETVCRQICRAMTPGARFRIVVPDAELLIRRYIDSPEELVARREGETAIEAVNSYFRQRYEHQFLYDWEAMRRMLLRAGFADVVRARCGEGANPALVLDDGKYEWESLYVEAIKG